jgi:hypothetical protein
MASNNAVVNAIMSATGDARLQAAMLMGSKLESGWNPTSVGDQGTSFGPFQIHLPAHPGVTASEAENPSWAVNYMMPAYEAGVAKVPNSLWQADPAQAAATAAYYAERPAKMYGGYAGLWSQVQAAMNGQSVATGGGSGTTGTGGATTTDSVSSSIFSPIQAEIGVVGNDLFMVGMMISGIVLIVVGIFLVFRDASKAAPTPQFIERQVEGGLSGTNSNSGRNSSTDTSSSKSTASTPTADAGKRTANKSGSTTKAGGLNTGRAVAGTVVGRSVSPTAGRPQPKRVIRLDDRPGVTK